MKMNNIKTVKIISPVYGLSVGTVLTRENPEDMFYHESFSETEKSRYSHRFEISDSVINKNNSTIVETFKSQEEITSDYIYSIEKENDKLKQEIKELLTQKGELRAVIAKKVKEFKSNYEDQQALNESMSYEYGYEFEPSEAMVVYANLIEMLSKLKV